MVKPTAMHMHAAPRLRASAGQTPQNSPASPHRHASHVQHTSPLQAPLAPQRRATSAAPVTTRACQAPLASSAAGAPQAAAAAGAGAENTANVNSHRALCGLQLPPVPRDEERQSEGADSSSRHAGTLLPGVLLCCLMILLSSCGGHHHASCSCSLAIGVPMRWRCGGKHTSAD